MSLQNATPGSPENGDPATPSDLQQAFFWAAMRENDAVALGSLVSQAEPPLRSFLWAVWQGGADEVERLIPTTPFTVDNLHRTLLWAALQGHAGVIAALMASHSAALSERGYAHALRHAAEGGHVDTVRILLPRFGDFNTSYVLIDAASRGQEAVVHVLISACRTDPSCAETGLTLTKPTCSQALRLAAQGGHVGVVKQLLPVSDPEDTGSPGGGLSALALAAEFGHGEVLRILLSVADPKANGSQALLRAALNNQSDMIQILAPISDLRPVWDVLVKNKAWRELDTLVPVAPLEWVQEVFRPTPLAKMLGVLASCVPQKKFQLQRRTSTQDECSNAHARLRALDQAEALEAVLPPTAPTEDEGSRRLRARM